MTRAALLETGRVNPCPAGSGVDITGAGPAIASPARGPPRRRRAARGARRRPVVPWPPPIGRGLPSVSTMIDVQHVTKDYATHRAVTDVTFKVDKGEVLGFLGPNGAGKTTLFRMITGQETPDEGTIRIGDTVVLGYVDQNRPLDPDSRSGRRSPRVTTRSSSATARSTRAPTSAGSTSRGAISRRRSGCSPAASATASTWRRR